MLIGNVLCVGSNSILVLDANLQIIKSMPFNGQTHCTLNHRNEIYVPAGRCKIFLFDLNLKELKQFGSLGKGNDGLFGSLFLHCDDEYLYVGDM